MKLNLEQSKHLAGTIRITAIGLFGLYGYPFLSRDEGSVEGLVFVTAISFLMEVLAMYVLSEDQNNG